MTYSKEKEAIVLTDAHIAASAWNCDIIHSWSFLMYYFPFHASHTMTQCNSNKVVCQCICMHVRGNMGNYNLHFSTFLCHTLKTLVLFLALSVLAVVIHGNTYGSHKSTPLSDEQYEQIRHWKRIILIIACVCSSNNWWFTVL